jgi:uncharacterized protein (TIGR03085 family)
MPDAPLATSKRERALLADLFDEVGPDAPTLCGDWTTRDLAAHLVMRERRPDAAPGVVVPLFAGYTDKVQASISAAEWSELVGKVRKGPQMWSPTRLSAVDKAINTVEFFVHHEDVRRATDDWTPRELDQAACDDLRVAAKRGARMLVRGLKVGLVLHPTDTSDSSPIVVKSAEPTAAVTGPIGEIVLFIYGRKDVAQVEISGPDDAVEAVRSADLGL